MDARRQIGLRRRPQATDRSRPQALRVVGPLRLWQYEEGDINPGHAYILRGLKVVYDRIWDARESNYVRSANVPKIIECNLRTALEHVEGVQSITEYL